MSSAPIVEGLLAIHKPASITSAQVIRDVQEQFTPSDLFKPWIENERARLQEARGHQPKKRFRRDRRSFEVKIGHGGTLDPMATGVLILGIGAGTKKLGDFLSCTKSYETVVLFGQATDTYDVTGKTVARKPFDHITKEKVEEALSKFQGSIMQRPPIYSALRVQGKKLYEYAREGKEVPVEIQERPVTAEALELVDWYEGGSHQYHWPQDEAPELEKKLHSDVLHLDATAATQSSTKRARSPQDVVEEQPPKRSRPDADNDAAGDGVNTDPAEPAPLEPSTSSKKPASMDPLPDSTDRAPCPAPACRLRMTVTSGFYVRSLCHDLGEAVESLGAMASLVRTRQGDFELGKNVLEYDDLAKGEDVWGPRVKDLLLKSSSG